MRRWWQTVMAVLVTAATVGAALAPATARAAAADVDERVVSLTVRNANGSGLACPSDGRRYELSATLVGPAATIDADQLDRVNVLVHDFTLTGWVWHSGIPGYDYAQALAEDGETSLVIDRLGYGGSPLQDGTATCLGAQADMLHQVITRLRRGDDVPQAARIVVHGHSVGAAIAELEAAKWKDIDGLVEMSWSATGVSARAITEAMQQNQACYLNGGGVGGAPKTYAWYGATPEVFTSLHFATAESAVREAAVQVRAADPCGDAKTLAMLAVRDGVFNTRLINVPVLIMFGGKDVLNRPDAMLLQSQVFGPSAKVTAWKSPPSGGLLPLEAEAPAVRSRVISWLDELPD